MKRSALLMVLGLLIVAGCNHVPRADSPDSTHIFYRYKQIELNCDTSTSVLSKLNCEELKEEEYVSQSESVLAKWGQRGDYAVSWFNIIAFDEDSLTAKRKYGFWLDEDSPGWGVLLLQESRKLRLDMQLVMDDGILDEPYASENARRKAIIEKIRKQYLADVVDIRSDSHAMDSVSMMISSSFNQILEQLERSPALAAKLTDCKGMTFDHRNLNEGRLRLIIDDETKIVYVKMKIGQYVDDFECQCDVRHMGPCERKCIH